MSGMHAATPQNEIMTRIAQGDRDAFSTFYRAHQKKLTLFAMTILAGDVQAAEDVVDEAFLDLWKNASRTKLRGDALAWMRRVVRNKAVDWLRKYGGEKIDMNSIPEALDIDEGPDPEQNAQSISDSDWLKAALLQLSSQHREVIQLFYFEELPVAEIAAITECPVSTAKTRLHYARNKLSEIYEKVEV